jgi:hypothetical protein
VAASAVRLTDRDAEMLGFLAEHRFVLASQMQTLFRLSTDAANGRLRALARAGFITYRRIFHAQPACCQITPPGLAAIGSELPSPRFKLACYEHDVGVAWLWVAARRGAFGPLRDVLGERYGVRLGGVGPGGRERLHYPDLLLVTASGERRIALELELTAKGQARRESILAGYANDERIDGVLYLVEDRPAGRAIARAIEASASWLGIDSLVALRRVRLDLFPGDRRGRGTAHHIGPARSLEASR